MQAASLISHLKTIIRYSILFHVIRLGECMQADGCEAKKDGEVALRFPHANVLFRAALLFFCWGSGREQWNCHSTIIANKDGPFFSLENHGCQLYGSHPHHQELVA